MTYKANRADTGTWARPEKPSLFGLTAERADDQPT
jgi:hypothetical protein